MDDAVSGVPFVVGVVMPFESERPAWRENILFCDQVIELYFGRGKFAIPAQQDAAITGKFVVVVRYFAAKECVPKLGRLRGERDAQDFI